MMSPLPQRVRAAYDVQGNDKPLATKSNWAMTFDNHEDAKMLIIKLIAPITILHHCKSAIATGMKLVCLQLPSQQMCRSKTFVSSLREATSTWLHCMTNNVVHCRSYNNSNSVCTLDHGDCADDHHHSLEVPKCQDTVDSDQQSWQYPPLQWLDFFTVVEH